MSAETAIARYPGQARHIRSTLAFVSASTATARPARETLECRVCHGAKLTKHGGPCWNCQGTGTITLSNNRMLRAVQLTGRTIGTAAQLVKALATVVIILIVLYLIVRTVA